METRGEYLIDQPLPLPRTTSGFGPASAVAAASGVGRTAGSVPSSAWFNLSIDRERAVAVLTGKPLGAFIVRARYVAKLGCVASVFISCCNFISPLPIAFSWRL
jgi:hypothetical protein